MSTSIHQAAAGWGCLWAWALLPFVVWTAAATTVDVHYVSLDGGNAWPYTTWGTAATNIQAAVDAAGPGDLVLVADGLYSAGSTNSPGDSLNRVVINKPITVRSLNGPDGAVIKGSIPGGTRCVYIDSDGVLSGFTLWSGRSDGATIPERSGGGAYCAQGGIVKACVIHACHTSANGHGGGVYLEDGGALLDTTISNCTATLDGGGVYGATNALIRGCTVAGNTAGRDGGGVFTYEYSNDPGGSSFTNSTVSGNTANHDGGGIYHRNVSGLTLTNITVSGNHAINVGGGIYNNHSTEGLSLVNNTVSENLADVSRVVRNSASALPGHC